MNSIPFAQDTITVAGRILSTAGLISLHGKSAGANQYCSPRKPNASSGYQVPVGKKFQVMAYRCLITTEAAALGDGVSYADNDSGTGTNSAPTNQVFPGAQSAVMFSMAAKASVEMAFGGPGFEVPAGKYPTANSGNSGITCAWEIFGYEVNA